MVQRLRLHLPMQGVWVRSLVGELRSHMPPDQKKQNKKKNKKKTQNINNRSSIVTNSIKIYQINDREWEKRNRRKQV